MRRMRNTALCAVLKRVCTFHDWWYNTVKNAATCWKRRPRWLESGWEAAQWTSISLTLHVPIEDSVLYIHHAISHCKSSCWCRSILQHQGISRGRHVHSTYDTPGYSAEVYPTPILPCRGTVPCKRFIELVCTMEGEMIWGTREGLL